MLVRDAVKAMLRAAFAVVPVLALSVAMLVRDMPAARAADVPKVVAVYPSGPSVAENLLRFSIRFAAAPDRPVLQDIALENATGAAIDDAFLEQELWSPDRRVLTVLLHPGRVKTGLIAHDTLGRALVAGMTVRLLLKGEAIKSWDVEGEKRAAPNPKLWQVEAPQAGTTASLRILLEAPIEAQAANLIAVAAADGVRVPGSARLLTGETAWMFAPHEAWQAGAYRVMIHPRLEDAYGNEVTEAFEHPVQPLVKTVRHTIEIPFSIQ